MPSILSQNQAPQQNKVDLKSMIQNFVDGIVNSPNAQEKFNQFVSQDESAKKAMDIAKQYGNGDFKTAFMNYASQNGKQAFSQQIVQYMQQQFGMH